MVKPIQVQSGDMDCEYTVFYFQYNFKFELIAHFTHVLKCVHIFFKETTSERGRTRQLTGA